VAPTARAAALRGDHMPPTQPTIQRVYHVRRVLGRGGFGTVYLADLVTEAGFTKQVALKILHDDAHTRPDHLARLRDEARMLGLIRHRALVGADALVRLDGRWTVVMEYVPGVSLGALRKRVGALPVAVVAAIGAEVADALHAAYTAEVEPGRPLALVHRDVKPSNLQLTERGEVKVLDFGVARAEFEHREARTQQVVYGSPPYLAPERLEGVDSHEGDIFALGITLGELLSGRRAGPAAARPEAHEARIAALLEGIELPEALRLLLLTMLAYDASQRPDAAAVAAVLTHLAGQEPGLLATYAREEVPRQERHQGELPGELTGHRLTEETAPSELQELASGVPTTWNEQSVGPAVVSKPGTTWDGDISTLATVIPADAFLRPDELPPAKEPASDQPTPWRWVVGGVATAIALMAMVAVGTAAMVAVLVLVAGFRGVALVDDVTCNGAATAIADDIAACSGDPETLRAARALHREVAAACVKDEIGSIGATLLRGETQRIAADGRLDPDELDDLQDMVDRFLR